MKCFLQLLSYTVVKLALLKYKVNAIVYILDLFENNYRNKRIYSKGNEIKKIKEFNFNKV
ncbi:hypothetical protein AST12_10335 [Staphylococcus succinus]|nr:hypothetical protein AST12_10335 [Staphylococcus succinus]